MLTRRRGRGSWRARARAGAASSWPGAWTTRRSASGRWRTWTCRRSCTAWCARARLPGWAAAPRVSSKCISQAVGQLLCRALPKCRPRRFWRRWPLSMCNKKHPSSRAAVFVRAQAVLCCQTPHATPYTTAASARRAVCARSANSAPKGPLSMCAELCRMPEPPSHPRACAGARRACFRASRRLRSARMCRPRSCASSSRARARLARQQPPVFAYVQSALAVHAVWHFCLSRIVWARTAEVGWTVIVNLLCLQA